MYALATRLFPFHRSITGPGVRQTLEVLRQEIPIETHEVPTGTEVYDWQVPKEWRLNEAYIADENGHRIVDAGHCNLHIAGYSHPVNETMKWSQLKNHLVTLPQQPDWIPFRSGHFEKSWAFCLSHRQFEAIDRQGEQDYHVVVDSQLIDGSLSYGEVYFPGASNEEVLISTHVCHPSLANDNLSGIVVAAWLARHMQHRHNRYSYRFIFIPATIGAITWLALNEDVVARTKHGLVLSGIGDKGAITYKRSRRGTAVIDRAVTHVLEHSGDDWGIRDFEPFGYDERQFCSPGINLPMGCFMRTPNGEYPEYHSSGDNLDFIAPESLVDSLEKLLAVVNILEANVSYLNSNPYCEPRLGRHGLYKGFGSEPDRAATQRAVQWVLNLSDGEHSLLEIAERSNMSFDLISHASELLLACGLLQEIDRSSGVNIERLKRKTR